VGRTSFPNSNFLGQAWRWIFFFSKCPFVNDLFLVLIIHVFWIILVDEFLFFMCKIYLDIVNLILQIRFRLHICTLFFSTHCIFFNFKNIFCKCLNWFS
jgi:hypothetical protein